MTPENFTYPEWFDPNKKPQWRNSPPLKPLGSFVAGYYPSNLEEGVIIELEGGSYSLIKGYDEHSPVDIYKIYEEDIKKYKAAVEEYSIAYGIFRNNLDEWHKLIKIYNKEKQEDRDRKEYERLKKKYENQG